MAKPSGRDRSSRAGGRRPTGRSRRPNGGRAFDAALAAYDRGDFFLTHELLEPAWMGTDDIAGARALPGPDQAGGRVRPRRPRQPARDRQEPRGRSGSTRWRPPTRPARPADSTWRTAGRDRRRGSPGSPRIPTHRRSTRPDSGGRPDEPAPRRDPGRRRHRGRRSARPRRRPASRSSSTSASLDEFDDGPGRGAALMPMSAFAERHAELPKDRPILVMCARRRPDPRRRPASSSAAAGPTS